MSRYAPAGRVRNKVSLKEDVFHVGSSQMTEAGTKPTYANSLDFQHGRISSLLAPNTWKNKGPR